MNQEQLLPMFRLTMLVLWFACNFSPSARASDDDSCFPNWSLIRSTLDICNNLAFLSPGNDSRVNLRLLLADAQRLSLADPPLSERELQDGYGPVPFELTRLQAIANLTIEDRPVGSAAAAALKTLAELIGLTQESEALSGDAFLSGEGSRCRSNNAESAAAFLGQLQDSIELSAEERQALARSRLALLSAGGCQADHRAARTPVAIKSPLAGQFADYLAGATDFYDGRFNEADQKFASLQTSRHDWLKETALYMLGRTKLNAAQQNAFDEMGFAELQNVDKPTLHQAQTAFEGYLELYPQGRYAASAKGLLRRVAWLDGNRRQLAEAYTWQLTQSNQAQRNQSLDELVQEIDNKLLASAMPTEIQAPLLLAVADLMLMRHREPSAGKTFSLAELQAQQELFAEYPGLFAYLQSVFHFFVEKNPEPVLTLLPALAPDKPLDYLAFSSRPCALWRWKRNRIGMLGNISGCSCYPWPSSPISMLSCNWHWHSITSATSALTRCSLRSHRYKRPNSATF